MNLEVKKVTRGLKEYKQVAEIFRSSFPKKERSSMGFLLLMAKRDMANFWAFYDGETPVGMSFVIHANHMAFILYLAVDEEKRCQGYGSGIVSKLKEIYSQYEFILNAEKADPGSNN